MAVLPKIQEFLDQLAIIKAKLAEIGFKQNQANAREGLVNLTRTYMTDFDKTVFAVDDIVFNGRYPVPIRIYIPDLSQTLPVAAFIHGGGYSNIFFNACKSSWSFIKIFNLYPV